jgi:Tol biopolymer transport system component
LTTGEERNLLSVIPAPIDSYDSMVSMPGWSPDNQWLVYNTVNGDIFKINIETGENIYLTYGWAPDWR